MSVLSLHGRSGRVGPSDGIRRKMKIADNEYPACMFGSWTTDGLEMLGC